MAYCFYISLCHHDQSTENAIAAGIEVSVTSNIHIAGRMGLNAELLSINLSQNVTLNLTF